MTAREMSAAWTCAGTRAGGAPRLRHGPGQGGRRRGCAGAAKGVRRRDTDLRRRLWQVRDGATSVLMEEFYRNLWQKKQSSLRAIHRQRRCCRPGPGVAPPAGVAGGAGAAEACPRRRCTVRAAGGGSTERGGGGSRPQPPRPVGRLRPLRRWRRTERQGMRRPVRGPAPTLRDTVAHARSPIGGGLRCRLLLPLLRPLLLQQPPPTTCGSARSPLAPSELHHILQAVAIVVAMASPDVAVPVMPRPQALAAYEPTPCVHSGNSPSPPCGR